MNTDRNLAKSTERIYRTEFEKTYMRDFVWMGLAFGTFITLAVIAGLLFMKADNMRSDNKYKVKVIKAGYTALFASFLVPMILEIGYLNYHMSPLYFKNHIPKEMRKLYNEQVKEASSDEKNPVVINGHNAQTQHQIKTIKIYLS